MTKEELKEMILDVFYSNEKFEIMEEANIKGALQILGDNLIEIGKEIKEGA